MRVQINMNALKPAIRTDKMSITEFESLLKIGIYLQGEFSF